MKKNTKLFIGISAALVVVVGALLLLLFLPKGDTKDLNDDIVAAADINISTNDQGVFEAEIETTPEGKIKNNSYGTLLDSVPAKIKEIDVENESGTFKIKSYTPTSTKTNDDGKEETETETTVYTLVGYEKFELATGIPDAVANDAAALEFSLVASLDCKNPADYGLASPRAKVNVSYTDGSAALIKVGSVAPADAGVYVQFGTNTTVYLVAADAVDAFLYDPLDLFDKNINAAASSEDDTAFTSIKLSGSNYPKAITIENNNDNAISAYYKLTSPTNSFVSVTQGSLITAGIRGLAADKVVCVNPSGDQLKKYGVASPYAAISATYPDISVNLLASKPDDKDNVYIMEKGGKLIYQIPLSKVEWVDSSYDDILSEFILCPASNALTAVKVNDGKKQYNFDVSTKDEKVIDKEGKETTQKVTAAKYGDKELTLSNFEYFCQELIAIERNDIASKTPSGNPVLTVEYSYSTGRSNDTVKFYKDGNQYLAAVNGATVAHVNKAKVDKVITYVPKVAKDEPIT